MVSFKSLTLLTLSITATTAIPQYGHAHLHNRAIKLPAPMIAERSVELNDSEAGPIEAPERRWDRTRTWNGGNPYAQTTAPAAVATTPAAYGTGAAATTSAGAAAATSATGSASTGGKKGLAYNSNALLTPFSGASWAYNWANAVGGALPAGVEYVPMLWGSKDVGAWTAAVAKAKASGSTHALSFNEPDFPEQANMDASTAAQLHIANMAPLKSQGFQVGSPAISNSNIAGQGLDWMTKFLAACGGPANNCKIDFLTFHWYNDVGTFDNFKSHVNSVISLAKQNGINKVWLTEFAVNGGTSDQAAFLTQALPFLDSTPEVERYAYFMAAEGKMIANGALNAVGKAYSG